MNIEFNLSTDKKTEEKIANFNKVLNELPKKISVVNNNTNQALEVDLSELIIDSVKRHFDIK